LESAFRLLAHCKLGSEKPHPVLHHGQQIAYLGVGASFEPLAERRYNPQRAKPFCYVVRFRQFQQVPEQLHGGKLFWLQVLHGSLWPKDTGDSGELAIL
jgi:hypothetical protein